VVERISTTLAAGSIAATPGRHGSPLEKIAEGTYGVCESCGGPISAEQLEAMRQTPYCFDCAATRSSR
jgi:RNA polymerase-binding transcription factor DksA